MGSLMDSVRLKLRQGAILSLPYSTLNPSITPLPIHLSELSLSICVCNQVNSGNTGLAAELESIWGSFPNGVRADQHLGYMI